MKINDGLIVLSGVALACMAVTVAASVFLPPADPNACMNPALVLNPCRDVLPDGFFPPGYTGPRRIK
jgi:hypothetical protein